MQMSKAFLALALSAVIAPSVVAQTNRHGDQDAALAATREGVVRPLRSIENNLVPDMKSRGADYIGAEFNGGEQRYRLKFMRGSSVIWVDVDGRTGAIVGRAGE